MAAASAGVVQQAATAVSVAGTVDQQVVSALQQQQHHQQQQQHQHQQHLHQQQISQNHQLQPQHMQHHHQHQRQLLHQQQIRPLHHNIQYQSIPQQPVALSQQHQQRPPFVPRVGNGSQPIRHGAAAASAVTGMNPSAESQHQQQQQQPQAALVNNQQQQHALVPNIAKQQSNQMLQSGQHQQQPLQQQQHQPQTTIAANLAPGWRRLFSNNEIVYVSPTGATLRSHSQIKDYLLSPNTCKCGLPCPLRPEYFFDFNSQVPTILLQIPLENGLPSRSSSLVCSHQRKYFESQQKIMHKEIKRRKMNELSTITTSSSGKISTSPVPQCNSVTVYSGNVMQTSQFVANNGGSTHSRLHVLGAQQPGQVSNVAYQQQQQHQPPQAKQDSDNEKQIGSVTLSKTPPWRKNSILQQQQNQTGQSTSLQQSQHPMYEANNERIPPLPQPHLQQQVPNPTPPWQQHQQVDLIQTKVTKSRQSPNNASASKKKPNFKDDPTGYLDQQTAILHNSILNVVSSPDLNETSPCTVHTATEDVYKTTVKEENVVESQSRNEQQQTSPTVIPQNQNVYPRNNLQSSIELKQQVMLGMKQHLQNVGAANIIYQQSQPRMMAPSQIASKSHHQVPQGLLPTNRTMQQPPLPQAQVHTANVPSSQQQQQYLVDKKQPNQNRNHAGQVVRNAHFLTEADQQQATTTTIGGQTVTHFPNGMVQVEQNCDSNSMVLPLKPQQHVQLQQQIQQHNMLYRQSQQIQKASSASTTVVNLPATCHTSSVGSDVKLRFSHESPVSSSTTFTQARSDLARSSVDSKGPAQEGAISTSIESPIMCPSPADSDSTSSTAKSIPSPAHQQGGRNQQNVSVYGTCQTTSRNTITSVQAGRSITTTTTSTASEKSTLQPGVGTNSHSIQNREFQYHSQKLSPNHLIPVSSALSGLQLQPAMREGGNQLIMTSTGQLIVMPAPTQTNKPTSGQVIINSPGGSSIMHQQSVAVINQQGNVVNSVDVGNNSGNHIIQHSPNGLVIQNTTTGLVQSSGNMIQSGSGGLIGQNGQNFIVNSTANGVQSMLLNNSNILQQSGQNLNLIQTGPNGTKVISSNGNLLNQSGNIISPNNGGLIGQQTVVLNTLPNGYVIQPNFTTVDGHQVVGQIMNQDGGNSSFLHQQQTRQIILTSPDSKRKGKKRKSSASSSPSTPSSLSPQQSPNMQQQQQSSSMVQITSQYPSQGFQISPGIPGIAMMNKNSQTGGPQQQIIFQNGQIIQPMNIIGQQLIVPAGLVMAPDTTLLQIQNLGACGNIITPQGMVLRASSPQNKNFLSPGGHAGQQFIVSGNNQMSPLGQIYGAPVSLVVPQQSNSSTFMQQNATIVQQQASSANLGGNGANVGNTNSASSGANNQAQGLNHGNASPPDTTTHSPRSPERPPSERSGGSDMVQCVSSSEPDSVVSPVAADSAQSPSTTDYDRSSSITYQSNTKNIYKPSDAKIRRVETPPQFHTNTMQTIIRESSNQMPPDSHESPSHSPTASSASSTSPRSAISMGGSTTMPCGISIGNNNTNNGGMINTYNIASFSIGQLVWGAARGHPAWPGKIVNPPEGACTPSDSTWVQWFGGRSNPELVGILSLKTLSEGLEAHHKAQKDTRKSRKLNQQLERAIQEAMTELDRISAMAQPTSTTHSLAMTPTGKSKSRGRQPTTVSTVGHQRTKPIKIAPAPPCTSSVHHQQQQQHQQHRQQSLPPQHHQHSQSHQQQVPQSATHTSK